MDGLTGWDWFVLVIVGLSMLFGLVRGLIKTVFALAAWGVAIVATPVMGASVMAATGLQQHPWLVFIALFLTIFIVVKMIGNLLARGIKRVGLGGADRGMGMLLGFARGLIIVAIAAVIARQTGMDDSDSWRLAMTRPLLEQLSSWADFGGRQSSEPVRQT